MDAGRQKYEEQTLYSEWMSLRDRQRLMRSRGSSVIKGSEMPWESNPHGIMRWYLHPALTHGCHRALILFVQQIPPGSRSGKQHCQGGIVHFVWKGRGRTIINGIPHNWKSEDVLQLPILPEGVVFQHFNEDPDAEALLVSALPNLSDPLGIDRGAGFFQLEAGPEYRGEFQSEEPELEALRKKLKPAPVEPPKRAHEPGATGYDRNYARTHAILDRSRTGKVLVRLEDRPEEMTRQGRIRYYLNPTLSDTVLKDWNVFTHELRSYSGKHRHQGGLAIFVLEGKGYTVVDGRQCDWESGDLILLPIQPGGVEHQHFNLNGDQPSRWVAFIYKPFHDEVAHEMEQREESPEFRREQR